MAEPDAIPPDPEHVDDAEAAEAAEVRPLPVLAEPRPIERARPVALPAAVAAATGGFLLGVAAFVLVRILRRPRAARSLRLGGPRGRGRRTEVAASRSFLVDIHLLKDR